MYKISTAILVTAASTALAAPGYYANGGSPAAAAATTTCTEEAAAPTIEAVEYTMTPYHRHRQTHATYQPAATSVSNAPIPTVSTSPSTGSDSGSPPSSGSSGSYMDEINHYRSLLGKPAFVHSPALEAHALKTSSDNAGNSMNHEMFQLGTDGIMSWGQNIADNKLADIGGACLQWLCEIPSLLPGKCDSTTGGGETGHATNFDSSDYTLIGCGRAGDGHSWCCDFGSK